MSSLHCGIGSRTGYLDLHLERKSRMDFSFDVRDPPPKSMKGRNDDRGGDVNCELEKYVYRI